MTTDDSKELIATRFAKDPRVNQAKELLLTALKEYQENINTIKKPFKELEAGYEQLLKQAEQTRGNSLYYPYIGSGFGNGLLVELMDGSIKYDLIGGIGVHIFGHNHPLLLSAAIDASLSDISIQGHLQQNSDSIKLSKMLVDLSGLQHCFLTSSGAMANENALKIILQKKSPACRLLAFDRCFAGRTLTCTQITDKPAFREGLPSNIFVDYIPFYDSNSPQESIQRAIDTLKGYLRHHPKEYAAMIFELVQGEAGVNVGNRDFFVELMKVLKENHIAVFVDEVQTFARTPALFAFHYFQLQNYVDVVTIGKISQVCATLYSKEFNPRPGLLSQTFTASTASIHISYALIKYLIENNIYGPNGKIVEIQSHFMQHLHNISKRHPKLLHSVQSIGAMFSFVPFEGKKETTEKFAKSLFSAGVITFIAGDNPTRIRCLVPAVIMTPEDVTKVCDIIEKVLVETDLK